MWRSLFSPEILFLVGTLQAVFPYLYWRLYGQNKLYAYEITYVPVVIWTLGYLAFWLGAKCARHRSYDVPQVPHFRIGMSAFTWILAGGVLLQLAILFYILGGIPIAGILGGGTNVWDVDSAIADRTGFGQMGLLLVSLFVLNGVLLILLLHDLSRKRPRYRKLFLFLLLLEVFAGLQAGKRQALAITLFFLACGMAVYFRHPVLPLLRYFRVGAAKHIARISLIVIPMILVAFIGWMAKVRTGLPLSGPNEVARYLELGVINLEVQVEHAGYGPYEFYPMRLFRFLLPRRLVFGPSATISWGTDPPRAEQTAGAGFFGDLHWDLGLAGCLVFAFLVGWFSKALYQRARENLLCLLVYAQVSWTLFAAHSYNHFLWLNFIWVPVAGFIVIAWLSGPGVRLRLRFVTPGSTIGGRPTSEPTLHQVP